MDPGSKITSLELSGFAGNLYREVTCTLTFGTIGLNDSSSSDRLLGASVTYNVSCIMCVKTKCPLKWNKTDVFKKKVEKNEYSVIFCSSEADGKSGLFWSVSSFS